MVEVLASVFLALVALGWVAVTVLALSRGDEWVEERVQERAVCDVFARNDGGV